MAKPKSFFMFCTGDFARKLPVPASFVEDRELSGRQLLLHLLTKPEESSWAVKIRKINGQFFFVDGWSKFVADNHILEMKLLNFHIAGNSTLHVGIFGHDLCLELETEMEEEPEKPLRFVKRLKEYHFIDQRLEMPKEFANSAQMRNKAKISLQDWMGRKWAVNITDRNSGIRALSAGWKRFLTANNLEAGAMLLFDFDIDSYDVIKVVLLEDQVGEELLTRATSGGFIIPS